MNKHIELVKKWLANPESITKEELLANNDSANAVYYAAEAAAAALYGMSNDTAYWVKEYEKLTKSTCNRDIHMEKPIKSNGGSSAYYTLVINDQTVETEDVIRDVFANDFDFGNAFKSLVRAYGALNGAGKDGSSIEYEMNKIRYSCNKIKRESFKNA